MSRWPLAARITGALTSGASSIGQRFGTIAPHSAPKCVCSVSGSVLRRARLHIEVAVLDLAEDLQGEFALALGPGPDADQRAVADALEPSRDPHPLSALG